MTAAGLLAVTLIAPVRAQKFDISTRDGKAASEALNGWWGEAQKTRDQRLAWWREARFGCFIHWGAYSMLGGEWKGVPVPGYAEHIMRIKKIPLAEYTRDVAARFNPTGFDAEEWVKLIERAGMRYLIITAKHHDGFAMYPSAVSKYNLHDVSPFKRDPMKELAEACKRHGIRFGFYYSHAFDWEDPNAPGNDWDYDNPGGDRKLHGDTAWYDLHPEMLERVRKYVNGKAIPQVLELIRNYHPDILWFDTPQKLPLSEQLRILKAVRAAAPDIVVDGRCARGASFNFGDYENTGDRAAELPHPDGDWETIPTTNESYGWHKHDLTHKPPAHFVQLVAKAAARGGNVLLNIGPMGDGRIDPKDRAILEGIGTWMGSNAGSIRGTTRTPLAVQAWGESTRKGNELFLHVFDWPRDGRLVVGGILSEVKAPYPVTRLNERDIALAVPKAAPDAIDSVIRLQSSGPIKADATRLLSRTQTNVLKVFDATLHGGLKLTDGKSSRAYAANWTRKDDVISWKVRAAEAGTMELSVTYSAAANAKPRRYKVEVGSRAVDATVEPTARDSEPHTVKLGSFRVDAGEFEIRVRPLEFESGELMHLWSLTLAPR